MIINIRGTNGAGKSWIVHRIMEQYSCTAVAYPETNKQKPMGYLCISGCSYPECDCAVEFPKNYKPSEETECPKSRRLFIPGHYEIKNGGIDTLPDLKYAYRLILKHHELGNNILYEGKNLSDNIKNIKAMHLAKMDVRVVFIDHPLPDCIKAVHDRGHRISEKTITTIYNKNQKEFVKLRSMGIQCQMLSRRRSFHTISKWLQDQGGDHVCAESAQRM